MDHASQSSCSRTSTDLYSELEVDWTCGQLRYDLQGKRGSSCSTKLCTTAVEMCTGVLASSRLCLPQVMAYRHGLSFCQQIYFVCIRSVATADAVWPVHNQLRKGRGAGRQQLVVSVFYFFSSVAFFHDWGKGRGCRLQCEAATAQHDHNFHSTHRTHSHIRPWCLARRHWHTAQVNGGWTLATSLLTSMPKHACSSELWSFAR